MSTSCLIAAILLVRIYPCTLRSDEDSSFFMKRTGRRHLSSSHRQFCSWSSSAIHYIVLRAARRSIELADPASLLRSRFHDEPGCGTNSRSYFRPFSSLFAPFLKSHCSYIPRSSSHNLTPTHTVSIRPSCNISSSPWLPPHPMSLLKQQKSVLPPAVRYRLLSVPLCLSESNVHPEAPLAL
jgi:hypothetical protein